MRRLLHHHWLDGPHRDEPGGVTAISAAASTAEIRKAVDDYLGTCSVLDTGLVGQVELDLEALTRLTGRELDAEERARFRRVQRRAQRWTYLGSGMTHPRFVASLADLGSEHRRRVAEVAPSYC
jgi:hypothetical protein